MKKKIRKFYATLLNSLASRRPEEALSLIHDRVCCPSRPRILLGRDGFVSMGNICCNCPPRFCWMGDSRSDQSLSPWSINKLSPINWSYIGNCNGVSRITLSVENHFSENNMKLEKGWSFNRWRRTCSGKHVCLLAESHYSACHAILQKLHMFLGLQKKRPLSSQRILLYSLLITTPIDDSYNRRTHAPWVDSETRCSLLRRLWIKELVCCRDSGLLFWSEEDCCLFHHYFDDELIKTKTWKEDKVQEVSMWS